MTSSELDKAEERKREAQERRLELFGGIAKVLLGLGALVLAVVFLVFVLQHRAGMTGTMLAVLYWATIGLLLISGSSFVSYQIYVRLIKKDSPVMPGLIAGATGALAGAANDIVTTTAAKTGLAVVLGLVGYFASVVFKDHKIIAMVLIALIPVIFLGVFLTTKSPTEQHKWVLEQGLSGLFWAAVTVVVTVVSMVIAYALDKHADGPAKKA